MKTSKIPKVIHYCWFGDAELGGNELACIESWRRLLPEYEIKRWDESNFDVNACEYSREAYQNKMWAFVSDYARFKILYDNGGVYLDTDVEMLKSIDELVEIGPFMGFQDNFATSHFTDEGEGGSGTVAPGLGMAAFSHMPIFEEILQHYETNHFSLDDGSCDVTNVVDITTGILTRHGLTCKDGAQEVAGITIYPAEYFNPKDSWTGEIRTTEDTYTIHHFGMSWLSSSQRLERRMASWLVRHGCRKRLAVPVSKVAAIACCCDYHRVVNIILGRKNRN